MNQHNTKKRVLFLCTENAARSQMAEGLLLSLYGDRYEVYSAGVVPSTVNPNAIRAMKEIGIDISGQWAKNVKEFLGQRFDYIVTVCDQAREACPFFPGGVKYIHVDFEDPAAFEGTEEEVLPVFRRVRDGIRDFIEKTFGQEER